MRGNRVLEFFSTDGQLFYTVAFDYIKIDVENFTTTRTEITKLHRELYLLL